MDRRGFTFLELMVVLILMAVLTAVAAPALGRMYQAVAVDSSSRRVMAVFQRAKDEALRSRGKVQVKIYPADGRFDVADADGVLMSADIPDTSIESVQVGGEYQPLGSEISVDIYPMMVKKRVTVSLKGSGGRQNDVVLNVGGGHIAVR